MLRTIRKVNWKDLQLFPIAKYLSVVAIFSLGSNAFLKKLIVFSILNLNFSGISQIFDEVSKACLVLYRLFSRKVSKQQLPLSDNTLFSRHHFLLATAFSFLLYPCNVTVNYEEVAALVFFICSSWCYPVGQFSANLIAEPGSHRHWKSRFVLYCFRQYRNHSVRIPSDLL